MSDRIIYADSYTRSDIRGNPDRLYAFGDNLARRGLGGQAKEARGEPNAVGIPTKRLPSMDPRAFFTDADLEHVRPIILAEFRRLADHVRRGGVVVIPSAGIGTGRARLAETAPGIRYYLDRCFARLASIDATDMAPAPRATPPTQ